MIGTPPGQPHRVEHVAQRHDIRSFARNQHAQFVSPVRKASEGGHPTPPSAGGLACSTGPRPRLRHGGRADARALARCPAGPGKRALDGVPRRLVARDRAGCSPWFAYATRGRHGRSPAAPLRSPVGTRWMTRAALAFSCGPTRDARAAQGRPAPVSRSSASHHAPHAGCCAA
jgi:hypothetical protein